MESKVLGLGQVDIRRYDDPRRGFIYATGDVPRGGSKGFFDASAGMVGFTDQFFFGVSAHHLNMPNESMIVGNSPMPIRLTGHMGASIPLGGKSQYTNETSIMRSEERRVGKGCG